MAVENKMLVWTFKAAEDLSNLKAGTGDLYKGIAANDRKAANNGKECSGIIQHGDLNTGHVTVGISGIMKFTAAAAVTAGQRLTCTTSGYMTKVDSGLYCVGRCGVDAVASGAVGLGIFDFSNPSFIVNCADLPA